MKNLQKRDANPERDGNVFAYQYTLHDQNFELQEEAFDNFCGEFNFTQVVKKSTIPLYPRYAKGDNFV